MKTKRLSSLIATLLTLGTFAITANALSPNGKEFYIPKTISSTASETFSGTATGFSFKVTQILNEKKQTCNYKRIRIKASGPSGTAWLMGMGFNTLDIDGYCSPLTPVGQSNFSFRAYKGTRCEIVAGDNITGTFKFYYYGNSPKLNAYATLQTYSA